MNLGSPVAGVADGSGSQSVLRGRTPIPGLVPHCQRTGLPHWAHSTRGISGVPAGHVPPHPATLAGVDVWAETACCKPQGTEAVATPAGQTKPPSRASPWGEGVGYGMRDLAPWSSGSLCELKLGVQKRKQGKSKRGERDTERCGWRTAHVARAWLHYTGLGLVQSQLPGILQ